MSNLRRSLQELGQMLAPAPPRHSKIVLEGFSTVPRLLPKTERLGVEPRERGQAEVSTVSIYMPASVPCSV